MRSAPTPTPAATPPRCYGGWYTWLVRTPANLSVTLGSSNEVTVLRNLPIPCSNPDFGPQVAIFLFLLRRRRVAHSHLPLCTSA